MLRKISFILFLAITLSGEGMLTVTLLWTILDKGGSAINIGLILAIMSVVPFLIQKYVRPVRTVLTHRPLQVFALARLGGLVVLGLPLLFPEEMMIYSLYLLAGLFSVILFLSIQSLEAYMSHMVLEGALSADQASNTLQTSIQIGAFGGNALAGLLLSLGGFFTVMIGLAVSLGIGMVLPYVASFFAAALNPQKREQEKTIKQTEITEESRKKILQLTVFAVCEGMGFARVWTCQFCSGSRRLSGDDYWPLGPLCPPSLFSAYRSVRYFYCFFCFLASSGNHVVSTRVCL